jgi:T-complex protein 1 subunit eta
MFCAGRVVDEDLKRTMKACGGVIVATTYDLNDSVLGKCESFEEKQIGGDRFNVFSGCPNAKACTIILRGGGEHLLDETERSLHDAIMIVRRTVKNDSIVAGKYIQIYLVDYFFNILLIQIYNNLPIFFQVVVLLKWN